MRFEAIGSRIACQSQFNSSSRIWRFQLQRQFQSSPKAPSASKHHQTASDDHPDHGKERDAAQFSSAKQIVEPMREGGPHTLPCYSWTTTPTAILRSPSSYRGFGRETKVLTREKLNKRLIGNEDSAEGGDNSGVVDFSALEENSVNTTHQHRDINTLIDVERLSPKADGSYPVTEGHNCANTQPVDSFASTQDRTSSHVQYGRGTIESDGDEDLLTNSLVRIRRVHRQGRRSVLTESGILMPPEVGLENTDVPQHIFRINANVDIKALEVRLYNALQTQDAHTVFQELRTIAYFQGKSVLSELLGSLPCNTFTEVLRHLDPNCFVGRYVKLHQEIGIYHLQLLGLPSRDPSGYHQFCSLFLSEIDNILHARRQISNQSTLMDYRYLLHCARVTGNIPYAQEIWRNMKEDSVIPDLKCYNDYLAARCYGENSNVLQRRRLRVIRHNTLPRTFALEDQPLGLRGHSVKRTVHPVGIQLVSSNLFVEMIEAGISGDEETFCLLMVASAREGELDGMAAILKRAWGIDVAALEANDERDIPPVKNYAPDSPFYPSDKLLFTLAHVYGINNQVSQAMRLVDYVSRQFDIPIPLLVWEELLRYTVIMSRKLRRGFSPELQTFVQKPEWGQLPRNAPERLWNTMTSEPYNIKPTMEMHDGFIHNLINFRYFGLAKEIMESGRRLHIAQVEDFRQKFLLAKADQSRSSAIDQQFHFQNPNVEWRRRDVAFAQAKMKRSRLYIRRWVVLWLKRAGRTLRYHSQLTIDMPDFVRAWKVFLPPVVEYHVPFGKVEIKTKIHEEQRRRQRTFNSPEWLGLQRKLLISRMRNWLRYKRRYGSKRRIKPFLRRT